MEYSPSLLNQHDAANKAAVKKQAKQRNYKKGKAVTATLSEKWLDKYDILQLIH